MTDNPAGEKTPRTNAPPTRPMPKIKVGSVARFLAVVPHLLGFHPDRSLVVVGLDSAHGRITWCSATTCRTRRIGPGRARSPGMRPPCSASGAPQRRSPPAMAPEPWSHRSPGCSALPCRPPGSPFATCCGWRTAGTGPTYARTLAAARPDGVAFDGQAHPAAAALTAAGLDALPGRASLAASLAPVTGAAAEAMNQATERALRRAEELAAPAPSREDATRLVVDAGRAAVREAIGVYRDGGQISDDDRLAWLAVMLADLRVRDDAWARMEPRHRAAHRRLWTDLVRRARARTCPRPRPCWRSPPGSRARAPWRTWRSSARWPPTPGTPWRICSARRSTRACRRRPPACR